MTLLGSIANFLFREAIGYRRPKPPEYTTEEAEVEQALRAETERRLAQLHQRYQIRSDLTYIDHVADVLKRTEHK